VVEAVTRVHPSHPGAARWLGPLLAAIGAGTFLYGTLFPLVDSAGVRLIVFWTLDSRVLTELIAIFVSLMGFSVVVWLVIARGGATGVARGVLRSTGLVGVAFVVHEAGGLIDLKGGVPAAGAVLGFVGASTILTASLPGGKTGFEDAPHRPAGSLRLVGPIAILLAAGLAAVALLMPWTTRPFPLRLVNLRIGPYWIWSIVVPSAIVIPVIVAAVRMFSVPRQRQTEVGIALAGGIFATLLFVRVVGRVLSSAPSPFPPVFSLEIGAYIGLAAGLLIVLGAVFHLFVLRH
jgi:hypothetical protein